MIPGDNEVRVEIEGPVMLITIDRPKVNAIDLATSRKLGEAFVYFRDNPELKVGIVTGTGEKIFSAGWDLKALENGEMTLRTGGRWKMPVSVDLLALPRCGPLISR